MLLEHLATLLEYPVVLPAGTCAAAIEDAAATDARVAEHLNVFATATQPMPLSELQELYTRTFDFDGNAALYVGHHLFGEDGRRGMLIAGLVERYERLRLSIGAELADHVAPILRSLARDSESEEARELVGMALRPAVATVLPDVAHRAAPYGAVLRAVALVVDGWPGEPFERGSDR